MEVILNQIVASPHLHARWLNTLSYLENCGARKISSCEHPTKVRSEMLKHAAEEFRHAYHLKRQIPKTGILSMDNYSQHLLLGGWDAIHYLNRLDVSVCRFLKSDGYPDWKGIAYLLITYAIEVRASWLYPLYQKILRLNNSRISVRSIILEEDEHLAEMVKELECVPNSEVIKQQAIQIENTLFSSFSVSLHNQISLCY